MFLIWGTTSTKRKKGFIAETCPHCEIVSSVQVFRRGVTGHFFWIPVGQGQFISAYGKCGSCNADFHIELTDYNAISKRKNTSLEELISLTNPKLEKGAVEASKYFNRLSAIKEPFLVHGHILNENSNDATEFDKISGMYFAGTFVIPLGIGFLASYIPKPPSIDMMIINSLVIIFSIGIIVSIIVFFRQPKRAFVNKLMPKIINDLLPLGVKDVELEECFRRFKLYGYKICSFINTKKVQKSLTKSSTRT